jgi:hypothetical protein
VVDLEGGKRFVFCGFDIGFFVVVDWEKEQGLFQFVDWVQQAVYW